MKSDVKPLFNTQAILYNPHPKIMKGGKTMTDLEQEKRIKKEVTKLRKFIKDLETEEKDSLFLRETLRPVLIYYCYRIMYN